MNLVPVILSGGAGTRLWPVSRELHPKPFMKLPDGQSLLQKAFLRAVDLPDVAEVITVTNRELFFKTLDEYRDVEASRHSLGFILEPVGRNTAPAIAAASLAIKRKLGPKTLMLILAADHMIADGEAFRTAVGQAAAMARAGRIVTFGIEPDSPDTGYGYIEADGNDVLKFVEKPSLELARQYVDAGYLWNSGMFCMQAGVLLEELGRYAPDILAPVEESIVQGRQWEGNQEFQLELDAGSFGRATDLSIDYAVMEKTQLASVVKCSLGWSDVGSWAAFGDLAPADARGNRTDGEVVLADVDNCYIRGEGRLVGAVGVRDLIIVDTPDALLVAHRDRVQDVRKIVSRLKTEGHEAYRLHRTVHRPWGTYTVLQESARFKIKRIEVKPGAALSLQMHHHRSEHWIVVSGMAKVTSGDREFFVAANESTYIPAGHKHRLANPGTLDLIMIEVQSGEYLGEDDIVRFEDAYGRN